MLDRVIYSYPDVPESIRLAHRLRPSTCGDSDSLGHPWWRRRNRPNGRGEARELFEGQGPQI